MSGFIWLIVILIIVIIALFFGVLVYLFKRGFFTSGSKSRELITDHIEDEEEEIRKRARLLKSSNSEQSQSIEEPVKGEESYKTIDVLLNDKLKCNKRLGVPISYCAMESIHTISNNGKVPPPATEQPKEKKYIGAKITRKDWYKVRNGGNCKKDCKR